MIIHFPNTFQSTMNLQINTSMKMYQLNFKVIMKQRKCCEKINFEEIIHYKSPFILIYYLHIIDKS